MNSGVHRNIISCRITLLAGFNPVLHQSACLCIVNNIQIGLRNMKGKRKQQQHLCVVYYVTCTQTARQHVGKQVPAKTDSW
jgi:hypothetical protein